MLIAGMGATHVNNFFMGMNLPYVDPKTLKKKEEEIGPVLQDVARDSCREAQLEEIALSDSDSVIILKFT